VADSLNDVVCKPFLTKLFNLLSSALSGVTDHPETIWVGGGARGKVVVDHPK